MTDIMPTIEERENLMKPISVSQTGFHPRSIQQLAVKRKPTTTLDIECNHFLRTKTNDFVHGHRTLEYQLWLEAGKHEAPFPQRPDESYNSNVWRNFRKKYGFYTTAEGRKISEAIASLYPLNIPAPSKVGDHTFEKYIRETKLFASNKFKALALERTKADLQEFKHLRIKSMARNPPIDESGQILPPDNFKKYERHIIPLPERPTTPPPPNQKTDSLGQRYVPKSKPHLWKLSYKINHPEYAAVKREIEKRKQLASQKEGHENLKPNVQTLPSPMKISKQ